jgi:hypothetical protein
MRSRKVQQKRRTQIHSCNVHVQRENDQINKAQEKRARGGIRERQPGEGASET